MITAESALGTNNLLVQLEMGMERLFLPLGPLYVADALRKHGQNVEIFHEMGLKNNIDRLLDRVKGGIDWVGFSVATSPQLIPTIEASKRIKQETDAFVTWGGMHPTIIPGCLNEPYIDSIVVGEGEMWVTGRPTVMDDFQPAWDLIDAERYGPTIYLITSRGCTHRCGFCYSPAVWKRRWKAHSVEKVMEIFKLYPLNPELVEFRDDYFFSDKNRAVEIVNRIGLPWRATIRAEDLDYDLAEKFKILPDELFMGVETSSERLLKLINKDITFGDIGDALNTAEDYGIKLYLTFIINIPTETDEEKMHTIRFASELKDLYKNVRCKIKKFRAYPGTSLFNLAVENGFNPPSNTWDWAAYALEVWGEI